MNLKSRKKKLSRRARPDFDKSKFTTNPDYKSIWFSIRRQGMRYHRVFKITDSATSTQCGKIVNNDDAMFPMTKRESDMLNEYSDVCIECSNHLNPISPWDDDVKEDIIAWE